MSIKWQEYKLLHLIHPYIVILLTIFYVQDENNIKTLHLNIENYNASTTPCHCIHLKKYLSRKNVQNVSVITIRIQGFSVFSALVFLEAKGYLDSCFLTVRNILYILYTLRQVNSLNSSGDLIGHFKNKNIVLHCISSLTQNEPFVQSSAINFLAKLLEKSCPWLYVRFTDI